MGKRCSQCKVMKPLAEFTRRADQGGYRYRCHGCDAEYSAARYAARHPGAGRFPRNTGRPPSYGVVHKRVRRERGAATEHVCAAGCGRQAAHWAYDHADPAEVSGPTGRGFVAPYSVDPARYLPLCRPCHTRFDREHADQRAAARLRAMADDLPLWGAR